jgi:Zn-dependent peptidase ImmA (M78 family)
MSDVLFEAPPRSAEAIENLADAVRAAFGWNDEAFFPIVSFVEKGIGWIVDDITFDVVDQKEMGARMGAVNPITREFLVRQDVYEGAAKHQPRDRFTLAHEAGHASKSCGRPGSAKPART